MGCDIHAYLDYDLPMQDGNPHAWHLAHFSIHRASWLFGILAGVRCDEVQGQKPVSPPKGLPERISYQVKCKAHLVVLDQDETQEDGTCTRKDAERWGGHYVDEDKKWVDHPDWHSHSWLSLEEVEEAIRRYQSLREVQEDVIQEGEPVPEDCTVVAEHEGRRLVKRVGVPMKAPHDLVALCAAMRATKESGWEPRFVFWFDN